MRPGIMVVELETEQGPWDELDYLREDAASNRRPLPAIMQVQHSGIPGQLTPYITERPRRVWIIEGGYCADTKYDEKMDNKLMQHEPLIELSTQYGYEVQYLPVPLGHAGTVYKSDLVMLTEIRMSRKEAMSILKKLHTRAVLCLHNIINTRRHMRHVAGMV